MEIDYLQWKLERLRDDWGQERLNLERLLGPIEQELREICASFEKMQPPPDDADDNQRWGYESFVDDKCEEIEGLLAVAFVVAQTHVTQVVSRAMRVLDAAVASGTPLAGFGSKKEWKQQLLRCGSALVPQTPYTQVEVLNAFANYFKHHEEWRGPWAEIKDGLASFTVKVITAAGASQGSTGNFRSGAEALGNKTYQDLGAFVAIISGWRAQVTDALEKAAQEASPA